VKVSLADICVELGLTVVNVPRFAKVGGGTLAVDRVAVSVTLAAPLVNVDVPDVVKTPVAR
jgi:hypothetical protein